MLKNKTKFGKIKIEVDNKFINIQDLKKNTYQII